MIEREQQLQRRRGRRFFGTLAWLALLPGAVSGCADDGDDCDLTVFSQNVVEPMGVAFRTATDVNAPRYQAVEGLSAGNQRLVVGKWVETDEVAYPENPDGSESEGRRWFEVRGYYKTEDGKELFVELEAMDVFANAAGLRVRKTSAEDMVETVHPYQFVLPLPECEMSEEEARLAA